MGKGQMTPNSTTVRFLAPSSEVSEAGQGWREDTGLYGSWVWPNTMIPMFPSRENN